MSDIPPEHHMAGETKAAFSHQRSRAGFTLMELSIVLVIIGLLVGGSFVGKELVRASELNSVLRDLDRYNAAMLTFKDKYGKLPGDISNATDFWGAAGGLAPYNQITNCYATTYAGSIPIGSKLTCNGNGNGMISGGISANDGVTDCSNSSYLQALLCDQEQFAVWQHLVNAGLESGAYIPRIAGRYINDPNLRRWWLMGIPGGNIPSSKFSSGEGFTVLYVCGITDYFVWSNACGHYFAFGKTSPTVRNNVFDFPFYAAFTTAEARGIDVKMDDGKPGSGAVLGSRRSAWTGAEGSFCANSTTASLAEYDRTQTGLQCSLYFRANF